MASWVQLQGGFLILGCVVCINSVICASSALLHSQGNHNSQGHVPFVHTAASKQTISSESISVQSPYVQHTDTPSDQVHNVKASVATGNLKPSSADQTSQSQPGNSATINLFVSSTSNEEKKVSRLHNSYIGASSNIMDYNEDTRKYMHRNVGRPQTRHLVSPSHRQNTSDTSSSSFSSDSGIAVLSNRRKVPPDDKLKPRIFSRTSPKRRLHLSIPVRMSVYKSGNTAQDSKHEILGEGKIQYPTEKESVIASHQSRRIYIPIRFNDDNMLFTTTNDGNCVRCPESYTLTPERGMTHVQVPVPEISVCPYLAFVPGRLNVAITSGPSVGSLISEGEYPVEVIVWKRGGHAYSCQFSFRVKLAQCFPLPASDVGFVNCTNDNLWGSVCHMTCPQNYVVAGHSFTKCEGTSENVTWTNEPLKCTPKKAFEEKNGVGCTKPREPTGGTVLCDKEPFGTRHRDGTVCQYFCFPGYVFSTEPKNSLLAICQNGTWSPNYEINCTATHCPRPPQPQHGYVQCNEQGKQPVSRSPHVEHSVSTSKYSNGTVCKFRCEIGYVIPTSQLPVDIIVCAAPEWNTSSIPDCKRAVPPAHHPEDCKNKTLVIEPGAKAKIILPRFTSSNGLPLTPRCSSIAILPPGVYLNLCEATDPEFRATSTCSYYIKVIERLVPQPHPKDCRDKVLTAGRSGTAVLKPTRFVITRAGSTHVIVEASCKYSKRIGIGSYINNCSATDFELNTTAYCSFSLTVKGLSCPQLPNISNGDVHCHPKPLTPLVYSPRTICIFKCDDGYVVTSSQKKWKKWKCLPKQLQWSQSKVPKCRRAVAPKPYAKDCHHKTLFLKGRKTIWPKKPSFKSSFKGAKVKVRCSLNEPLAVGLYTNFCEAKDLEMRTSTSCSFNITVKAKDCPALPEVPHSRLECSPNDVTFGYQVGVICRYACDAGYTIPSSLLDYEVHRCIAFRKWNISVLPSCVSKIAPRPTDSSCLHENLLVNDPLAIHWSVPSFVSSAGTILQTDCEPSRITAFGLYNISCSAYDPELRLTGSCQFTVDVQEADRVDELDDKIMHCPELPELPHSKLECSPADTVGYQIDIVCRYVCLPGYIIPSSLQDFVVRSCTELQDWNITVLPSCLKAAIPTPTDSSCLNQVVSTNDLLTTKWTVPNFVSSSGEILESVCEPSNITEYGDHNISCSVYDAELNMSSSCEFSVEVSKPSTTDELDIKFDGCQVPESFPNGELKCPTNSSLIQPLSTVCNYTCFEGYLIPFHQLHLSTIVCISEFLWNSTETPSCEAVSSAFLNPSCPDQSMNASTPVDVTVEIAEVITTGNTSANVSCTPQSIKTFGAFEITCEAYDPYFTMSAFCTFTLTVSELHLLETSSTESNLEIPEVDHNVPTLSPGTPCHPLTSPTNGHLNCAANEISDYCHARCNAGYHFPSAYQSLGSYSLTCDRSTALWNFETLYGISEVPDCLGELPTTSWQVWLKFKVTVGSCDESYMVTLKNEIQSWLSSQNDNICNIAVDCSQFEYRCDEDRGRNLFALEVKWTVEASFNPEDYENDDETVPNAETQIEMVLENTQRAVTVEQELSDLLLVHKAGLLQDSYRQGKFILVCQKRGFVVDPQSDKCVECSSGNFELKGQCEPCPANHYQDKTGQLACVPCPTGTTSVTGSKSLLECKE